VACVLGSSKLKLEIDINCLSDGWHKIGDVAVETGTIMLADPCFISNKADIEKKIENLFVEFYGTLLDHGLISDSTSYKEVIDIAKSNDALRIRFGEISLEGGAVVAAKTGFGDGKYPVFAKVEWDPAFEAGRVVGLWVDFLCGNHLPDGE